MKKRIILFDDDGTRRDSLSMLIDLCDDMECVGAFINAANAIENVKNTNADLVLMDIDMPAGNGIVGTKNIRSQYPDLPIIMQTVFEDNTNIFEAIKAGANGYLLKKTPPDKLLEQLREALEGGAPMTGIIAVKVLQYFKEDSVENNYNLSKRENEILKLLTEGHSYKMIAIESNISYFTVCNHIKKIYEKLHVSSATEAVRKALKDGLV